MARNIICKEGARRESQGHALTSTGAEIHVLLLESSFYYDSTCMRTSAHTHSRLTMRTGLVSCDSAYAIATIVPCRETPLYARAEDAGVVGGVCERYRRRGRCREEGVES